MCGIVGFTSNQPNANLAKFALNNLSHRGPDSQNFKEIKFGNSFSLFRFNSTLYKR